MSTELWIGYKIPLLKGDIKKNTILKDAGWTDIDALMAAYAYEKWSGESVSLEDIIKAVQGKADGGLFMERLVAWYAAAKIFMKQNHE